MQLEILKYQSSLGSRSQLVLTGLVACLMAFPLIYVLFAVTAPISVVPIPTPTARISVLEI